VKPTWRVEQANGRVSLYPSVDALDLDRCHFWLRDGKVTWVVDRD
jgi:hypothetical protein